MILIGMDDTDTLQSRGTGRLARQIATTLSEKYNVLGVTRHQLLVDPRVPYTKNNSSAAIRLASDPGIDLQILFEQVKDLMLADFQEGSDPGLCLAEDVTPEVNSFGLRAKHELLEQAEALRIAEENGILLAGLGGTQAGVIGALAAVGLAGSGEDGRFIQIGSIRELSGLVTVDAALKAGITSVETLDGMIVKTGFIQAEKIRPALRQGRPVQFVARQGENWQPLKLD
jgi:tRNA(Ile2) C34 agmatinyltransferase TiaS